MVVVGLLSEVDFWDGQALPILAGGTADVTA